MHAATIENVVSRAETLGCPAEPLGLMVADVATWRAVLAVASEDRAKEIVQKLNTFEEQRAQERDEAERQRVERVRRGEEEPNAEERATANQARIEAEAERQAYVAARPERYEERFNEMVQLLERVVAAVERR